MVLFMLFLQRSYLLLNTSQLPGSRLIVCILTSFFLLDSWLRYVVFVCIALDLRQILPIKISFFSFQLKHILLHDFLLLEPDALIFILFLGIFPQFFDLLFKNIQFGIVSNPF
jgi:hypothetical protein